MTTINDNKHAPKLEPTPVPTEGAKAAPKTAEAAPSAPAAPARTTRGAQLNAPVGKLSGIGLPAGSPLSTPGAPGSAAANPTGDYHTTFGHQSYVKNGSDPAMLSLMSQAVAKSPELAAGPLGQAVKQGHVGPDQVKALQTFLESKGYPVGKAGVDGKFGPDSHAGLASFMKGEPAKPATAPTGAHGTAPTLGAGAPSAEATSKAAQFIANAEKFKGLMYQWGGGHGGATGVQRVDCSGLVSQAAKMSGVNLSGTASSLQQHGQALPVNAGSLKPGDLVFKGQPAHHVGIYVGNGQVLHAPHTGHPVTYTTLHNFDSARRVI